MSSNIKQSTDWFRRYVSLITLVVVGALIYMIFFSDTSVMHKIRYQHTIDSLNIEVEINRDSMLYYKELNSRLTTDPEIMEQIVREQHNMKKPDEDVFIFVKE